MKQQRILQLAIPVVLALLLSACSDPRSTKLPEKLSDMESIQPQLQKLSAEEKNLLGGYLMRRAMAGTVLSGIAGDTGSGTMTIGDALDNQRSFINDKEKKETDAKRLTEQLKAEQESARAKIREIVTATLISKKIHVQRGRFSDIEMDKTLIIEVGYKNLGDKDIAMVKGEIRIFDLLDEEITGFVISNDKTIKAGASLNWEGERTLKYSFNEGDQKLADIEDGKYKSIWLPEAVVFTDGSKLVIPK